MSRLCPQVSWNGIHVNSSPPWSSIVARLETLSHRCTNNNNQWKFAHFQRPSCDQIAARAGPREFLVVWATRKPGVCQGSTRACREKKVRLVWCCPRGWEQSEVWSKNPDQLEQSQVQGHRQVINISNLPQRSTTICGRTGLQRRSLSRVQVFSFDSGEMGKPAVELHPCIGLMRPPLGRCGQDPYGSFKSWVASLLHLCGAGAFNLWARPGGWDRKSKLPASLVLHVRPSTCISCAVVADRQSNGGIPRR
ncbi:hypothetical protein CKAH01_00337 [Colletotrichum kahawae]|uniref:Uncharacterized protein n=1 Tax=Colletotrichum kahawae TaxID=34407 RepID=A0AAD9YXE7_COLKA|nr:hypothetical protein CKAH01_00337 [Colletotrichum kahawae]